MVIIYFRPVVECLLRTLLWFVSLAKVRLSAEISRTEKAEVHGWESSFSPPRMTNRSTEQSPEWSMKLCSLIQIWSILSLDVSAGKETASYTVWKRWVCVAEPGRNVRAQPAGFRRMFGGKTDQDPHGVLEKTSVGDRVNVVPCQGKWSFHEHMKNVLQGFLKRGKTRFWVNTNDVGQPVVILKTRFMWRNKIPNGEWTVFTPF